MIFNAALSLCAVVLLMLGAYLLLRLLARRLPALRPVMPGASPERSLAVETALPLDGRRRIVIVRIEQRRMALLLSSTETQVLGWL
jgi:flagellar biogenesis protein FliO